MFAGRAGQIERALLTLSVAGRRAGGRALSKRCRRCDRPQARPACRRPIPKEQSRDRRNPARRANHQQESLTASVQPAQTRPMARLPGRGMVVRPRRKRHGNAVGASCSWGSGGVGVLPCFKVEATCGPSCRHDLASCRFAHYRRRQPRLGFALACRGKRLAPRQLSTRTLHRTICLRTPQPRRADLHPSPLGCVHHATAAARALNATGAKTQATRRATPR